MSICIECETARKQLHHGFRQDCNECTARGLARSSFAFAAMKQADPHELRDAISKLLPTVEYSRARRMVHAWYVRDRGDSAKRASETAACSEVE